MRRVLDLVQTIRSDRGEIRGRLRRRRVRPVAEMVEGRVLLNAGDLDPTFGGPGGTGAILLQNDVENQGASAVAIDGDQIVITGTLPPGTTVPATQVGLLSMDGTPEQFIPIYFPATNTSVPLHEVNGLAIQSDGKIVVAGSIGGATSSLQTENWALGVARLNADGSFDSSFGINGRAEIPAPSSGATVESVAIQPDGKILVAGYDTTYGTDSFVERVNTNGTLDTSFGTNGIVTIPFPGSVNFGITSVAMQGNNIIVAGVVSEVSKIVPTILLIGLTPSGTYNSSFGTDGLAIASFPNLDINVKLAVDPKTQDIVAAGTSNESFAAARFLANGQLDSSFGKQGEVTLSFGGIDHAEALALDSAGDIVLAGYAASASSSDFALARLLPSGALDTRFGNGGQVLTGASSFVPQSLDNFYAWSVAIQPDGNIVVAGDGGQSIMTNVALARYQGSSTPTPPPVAQPPTTQPPTTQPPTTQPPTSQSPTSPSPTSQYPAPSPSPLATPPSVMAITDVVRTKKGITELGIAFNEPLNPAVATNTDFYRLALGVKKRHKLVFSRKVTAKAASYNSSDDWVTIRLSKPAEGMLQVIVSGGMLAANGLSSTSEYSSVIS